MMNSLDEWFTKHAAASVMSSTGRAREREKEKMAETITKRENQRERKKEKEKERQRGKDIDRGQAGLLGSFHPQFSVFRRKRGNCQERRKLAPLELK